MLFECVQSSFASNFRISKLLQIKKRESKVCFFSVHINLEGTSKHTEMSLTVALQDIKCTNILEVAYFYYELSIQPTVALGFLLTIHTNHSVRILCTNNQRLHLTCTGKLPATNCSQITQYNGKMFFLQKAQPKTSAFSFRNTQSECHEAYFYTNNSDFFCFALPV